MKAGVLLMLLSVVPTVQAQPAAYERCAACHTGTDTSSELAPSLVGVVGRVAGSREDFRYSRPMARSGITWDETTLDAFLRAPDEIVPGTRMPFEGIESDAERAELIEYMKRLK